MAQRFDRLVTQSKVVSHFMSDRLSDFRHNLFRGIANCLDRFLKYRDLVRKHESVILASR